jgi:PBP1b-binding outer membrane lipoprotein LpoB
MRKFKHILLILCGAAILSGCGVKQEKPAGSREPIIPYLA